MNNIKFLRTELFMEPVERCPLCHSGNINPLYAITVYEPAFKVDKCRDCGFIFMNPRLMNDIMINFYNENYYTGNAEYSYYDEREAEKFARFVWDKRINKIRDHIESGAFLDIGCAFGGLLKAASEYFTPYGVELSEYSGGYSKNFFGDNIHVGALNSHPFEKNFFAVITMIELIEHVADPNAIISECYDLLQKGGLLLIQTANMEGIQARLQKGKYAYYMPGHLSYFSKKNLICTLKKNGFKKIKIFHPVEFGLLPKLLKSMYNFKSILDHRKWLKIIFYHYISKIRYKNICATSSMVIYAFK